VAALPAAKRRKLVLDNVAERFGPKAHDVIDSAVRDPVGPIHWADTENSTVWPSFIDGAIVSGEREAKAIIRLRG